MVVDLQRDVSFSINSNLRAPSCPRGLIFPLRKIIKGGEGLTTEFKECRTQVNRDVYESICAFLNRNGGHIVLEVRDNGSIPIISPFKSASLTSSGLIPEALSTAWSLS